MMDGSLHLWCKHEEKMIHTTYEICPWMDAEQKKIHRPKNVEHHLLCGQGVYKVTLNLNHFDKKYEV